MEQLINALSGWFTAVLEALGAVVGETIKLFETPAQMIGLPVEIFAAVLLCLVLIALWRAMGRFIM
jgi:hypothetical protein